MMVMRGVSTGEGVMAVDLSVWVYYCIKKNRSGQANGINSGLKRSGEVNAVKYGCGY
jgi:hypothetical protein